MKRFILIGLLVLTTLIPSTGQTWGVIGISGQGAAGPTWSTDQFAAGTATADSYYDANYAPSKAIDGNTTDQRWCSTDTSYPHWWKIDLGNGYSHVIKKIEFWPWYADLNYYFHYYKWQGSTNNSDWTDLTTTTCNSSTTSKVTVDLSSNSTIYRYIRVYLTAGDSSCHTTDGGNYAQMLEAKGYYYE